MTPAELAAREGLVKVGGRPPLGAYLREVWQRREFIIALARYRIAGENEANRLGMGWVVLKPILNAAVYGTIFGFLIGGTKPDHFVEFLIIGMFFFEYFAAALGSGARSITANTALVQSLSFPRMALPLSIVVQRLLQFIPMVVVMLILVTVLGTPPHWHWLLLLPLIVLFTIFNAGVALITARLTAHFRDLNQLLPFVIRLLFYTTGIFFSFEKQFATHTTLLAIVDFQPVHEFLSLARNLLLTGDEYTVEPVYWLYASVWAIVVFVAGTVFFWAAEERYGRVD